MNGLKLVLACFCLFCSGMILVAASQDELTIDAIKQPSPPARGRGPFPGSHLPGHSKDFPIRLELWIPARPLEPNNMALVDFLITNTGTETLKVPVGLTDSTSRTNILTLYLTSDAIEAEHFSDGERMFPVQPTSAELFGDSDDPRTFCSLPPGKTIRVHASTRFALRPGVHSFTAHAELLALSEGRSEVQGTAESRPVSMRFDRSPAAVP